MTDVAILAVYLIVFLTTLFRAPKLDEDQMDADLEEAEEEGLLASTGRRFNATWQDITGRANKKGAGPSYGTAGNERSSEDVEDGAGTGTGRDSNW